MRDTPLLYFYSNLSSLAPWYELRTSFSVVKFEPLKQQRGFRVPSSWSLGVYVTERIEELQAGRGLVILEISRVRRGMRRGEARVGVQGALACPQVLSDADPMHQPSTGNSTPAEMRGYQFRGCAPGS